MKKALTIVMSMLYAICAYSQSPPDMMSYQAVIRNASGELVINSPVGIRISILKGSTSGTTAYAETHNVTSNTNGLVSLEIGNGTYVSGTFEGLDWSQGPYFLKNETDPSGGTNYTITGTSQLLSVPYALYAKKADTADYNHLTNRPDFTGWDEDEADDVILSGDQTIGGIKTFTNKIVADNGLDAGNEVISNVADPINGNDAANKDYVDALKQQIQYLENFVYNQVPPTNGLIAYYPFNGNANDESGYGYNGTVDGAYLTVDRLGKSNSAYSFNGTSDNKITVNFSTPLNTGSYNGLTISAWVKFNNLDHPPDNVLSILDGSLKGFLMTNDYTDHKLYVSKPNAPNTTSIRTQNIVNANNWYNLVLTYDNSTDNFMFYLNSVLQGELISNDFMPNATNLYIGYHNSYDWGLGWWMNGYIDDIRIYNRPLSIVEIHQLYNEGGYPSK